MKFGGPRTGRTCYSRRKSNGMLSACREREAGSARTLVLGLVLFLAGVGVSALLFSHRSTPSETTQRVETNATSASTAAGERPLTPTTIALLKGLASPVEIHFYSI